jgi:hypothetical protein
MNRTDDRIAHAYVFPEVCIREIQSGSFCKSGGGSEDPNMWEFDLPGFEDNDW